MAAPDDRRARAEDYPYDPKARTSSLEGLERLRAIADRKLAQYLYELHEVAERNAGTSPARVARDSSNARVGQLAERALAGGLGTDARELAEYLLVDEAGRRRSDEATLRVFAVSLRQLRAVP